MIVNIYKCNFDFVFYGQINDIISLLIELFVIVVFEWCFVFELVGLIYQMVIIVYYR